MTHMILERFFDEPITPAVVLAMATEAGSCFDLHRVEWHGSLLSRDGRRMACWFSGVDAESPRTALRQVGADTAVLWPAAVHDAPHGADGWTGQGVVVVRQFAEPTTPADLQALEDASGWCLDAHGVRFLRSFCARDQHRMLCLYQAPDAESVRLAQQQARMPLEDVWSYEFVGPTGSSAS
jgi:hypothetical protein